MTALDEIAWLLNLRGSDISYNPVFVSYVILTLDEATLYVEESKVASYLQKHKRSVSAQHVKCVVITAAVYKYLELGDVV